MSTDIAVITVRETATSERKVERDGKYDQLYRVKFIGRIQPRDLLQVETFLLFLSLDLYYLLLVNS